MGGLVSYGACMTHIGWRLVFLMAFWGHLFPGKQFKYTHFLHLMRYFFFGLCRADAERRLMCNQATGADQSEQTGLF